MHTDEHGSPEKFETWAVVELMGHQVIAGFVTEQAIAGAGFIRVDVPAVPATESRHARPAYTRYLAPGSLYALNPCTEEIARRAAASYRVADPIPMEFPADHQLAAGDDDGITDPADNSDGDDFERCG